MLDELGTGDAIEIHVRLMCLKLIDGGAMRTTTTTCQITPMKMKMKTTENFIEKIYRESSTSQWVRETLVNAMEARANRIEFGEVAGPPGAPQEPHPVFSG